MSGLVGLVGLLGRALAQVPGEPGPSVVAMAEAGPWSSLMVIQGETATFGDPVGLLAQASVSGLEFAYQGVDGPVSAWGPGMAVGFGARWRANGGTLGASARVEGRLVYTEPGQPPAVVFGPGVGLDTWWRLGERGHTFAVVSYSGPTRYYWSRLTLGLRVADFPRYPPKTLSIGVDGGARGTLEAPAVGTGVRVALGIPRWQTELAVRGGPEWTWDARDPGALSWSAGLALWKGF